MTRSPLAHLGLDKLWNYGARLYYEWALKEMGGDHPDAPQVVLRLNELSRSAK